MRYWIIPSNDKYYRVDDAVANLGHYIDWTQRRQYEIGDIVFIYKTKTDKEPSHIRYMFEVVEVGIKFNDIIVDVDYWTTPKDFYDNMKLDHVRLQLLSDLGKSNYALDRKSLVDNGLKSRMQGAITVEGRLLDFIQDAFIAHSDNMI
mgnify:FL=1